MLGELTMIHNLAVLFAIGKFPDVCNNIKRDKEALQELSNMITDELYDNLPIFWTFESEKSYWEFVYFAADNIKAYQDSMIGD